MSKSLGTPGNVIPLTACPYTRLSGEGVQMGKQFGVCTADIASGAAGQIEVTGAHTLKSLTGTAWADGDFVYWDDSAKQVTNAAAAGANLKIGHQVGTKASADATCRVRLTGAAT